MLNYTIQPIPINPRFINLTGIRFGMLTVVAYIGKSSNRDSLWLCRCDCGRETIGRSTNLKSGKHRSCKNKCLAREKFKSNPSLIALHPEEYGIWNSMKTRCYNENRNCYHNYGGRGITICDEWLNSFEQFFNDVGPRPSPDHSIDRIDNERGYEPGNVRWATGKEQCRNKRGLRLLTYQGVTLSLTEWAERVGITRSALKYRLDVCDCDLETALTTPLRGRGNKKIFEGGQDDKRGPGYRNKNMAG